MRAAQNQAQGGPACFSRIVLAVLVSTLPVRLRPRTVARGRRPQCLRSGGDRRANPCALQNFNRSEGQLDT
jgi:hypothetical protein